MSSEKNDLLGTGDFRGGWVGVGGEVLGTDIGAMARKKLFPGGAKE